MGAPAQPTDVTLIGLSAEEAAQRLATDGPNELPTAKRRNLLQQAWDVVRQPMLLLLVGAGVVYFLLAEPLDGVILMSFVVVVIAISLYQEHKTENALTAAARSLLASCACHSRRRSSSGSPAATSSAATSYCSSKAIACPPMRVLIDCVEPHGRRVGAHRRVGPGPQDGDRRRHRHGGDGRAGRATPHPWVFSGTLVVKGHGIAAVRRTRARTRRSVASANALRDIETDAHAAAARARSPRSDHRRLRPGRRSARRARVRTHPARLAGRSPRRHRRRHGDAARGDPGRAHRVPGARRLAHVATSRPHPPRRRHRDPRIRHRDLRRQDRHADAELDGGRLARSVDGSCPRRRRAARSPSGSTSSSSSPCSPRRSTRSTRWTAPSGSSASGPSPAPNTSTGDWDLVREYPLSEDLLGALARVALTGPAPTTSSPPRAPRKRSPISATFPHRAAGARPHRSRAAANGRTPGPRRRPRQVHGDRRDCPTEQHDFDFEYLGLVGLHDPVRPDAADAVAECHARRHPGRDDHRRLPGHRAGSSPARSASTRQPASSPDRSSTTMSDDELARRSPNRQRVRPHGARAEASAHPRPQGQRRGRRHDRRRRQRRPGAARRRHRHRHGRSRHRRRPRVRRPGRSPTTTSPRSPAASARAAGSSTTSARRWPTSSPSTSRSSG